MLKSISLAAALAALMTPVVMAWYPCYPAPLTLARLIGEPQCAANETAFHSFSQISIPDEIPSTVWNLVGNYNNLTWQGNDTITYMGIPNAPNDTRTSHEQNITESEVLNFYIGASSDPPNPTQTLYFMESRILPIGQPFGGVSFDGVNRLLIVSTNGTGSTMSLEDSGCAPNAGNATAASKLFKGVDEYNLERALALLTGGPLPTEE